MQTDSLRERRLLTALIMAKDPEERGWLKATLAAEDLSVVECESWCQALDRTDEARIDLAVITAPLDQAEDQAQLQALRALLPGSQLIVRSATPPPDSAAGSDRKFAAATHLSRTRNAEELTRAVHRCFQASLANLLDAGVTIQQQEIHQTTGSRLHASMRRISEIIHEETEVESILGSVLGELQATLHSDRAWLQYPADPQTPSIQVKVERTGDGFTGAVGLGRSFPIDQEAESDLELQLSSSAPIIQERDVLSRELPALMAAYALSSRMAKSLTPRIGKPWLLSLHQCSGQRLWTRQEQDFFQEVSHRLRDVLTTKQAQAELETTRHRFGQITSHMEEIFWVMNSDADQFTYMSPAVMGILGLTPDQLYSDSRAWTDAIVKEDRDRFLGLRDSEKIESGYFDLEYRIRRADGSIRWIHDRGFGVHKTRGQLDYLCGLARDITDRKTGEINCRELEEELRQAQKMEAVGQLAAGVAHDINNVLTAILGHTDMLNFATGPSEIKEGIEGIQRATDRASSVAHSLLTFSRKTQSKKDRQRLSVVAKETIRWLRHMLPASLEIIEQIDLHDDSWCEVDSSQIQQIMMNLAVNARDAMPTGGELLIGVRTDRSRGEEPSVILTFEDNGLGMTDEIRAHIFEPFYTTKERGQGTGLGLAIVHGLVTEHGGHIHVSSTPGEGACFTIALPHQVAPQEEPGVIDKQIVPRPGAGTLLLAEDQQDLRLILQQALGKAGYEVISARDGEDALVQFQKHHRVIQGLVLDIDLPKQSGLKALQDIRVDNPELPAILISGYPDAVPSSLPTNTVFLEKPFRSLRLCDELYMLLNRQPNSSDQASEGLNPAPR